METLGYFVALRAVVVCTAHICTVLFYFLEAGWKCWLWGAVPFSKSFLDTGESDTLWYNRSPEVGEDG